MVSKFIKQITKMIFSENMIIPWMIIVAIMPMILMSVIAYDIAKTSLSASIEHNLLRAIQKKIEIIDNYIDDRKLYLLQISELPTLSDVIEKSPDIIYNINMASLATYLNHFAARLGISNIYIINLNGKVIYTLNQDPLLGKTLSLADPFDAELYKAFDGAQILQMPYVYSNFAVAKQQTVQIYLSNRILDHNHLIKAVLVMKLDPLIIAQVINRYLNYDKSEQTILATLVNNQPMIVMKTKQDESFLRGNMNPKLLQLLKRAINGEAGGPVEIQQGTNSLLAVYRYVPELNMGMLIYFDKTRVFARITWLKINMLILIGIGLLIVLSIVWWISYKLAQANIKSELLLENILPKFVIEELKEKKQFVARNVYAVSIVFIDVVSFTAYAQGTPPEKVVRFLDEIFSLFDRLVTQFQLEKIKTIGDSYMAAAGLTQIQPDHANRAVDVGLAMLTAIQHYNIDHHTHFALRIGIDSGMVSSGIIGTQKFSYDLWGNAVNRASRMEKTGIESKIQITTDTYNALQHAEEYIITSRKNVIVKGIGTLDTYLVEGRAYDAV